jgi:hypothetical protein
MHLSGTGKIFTTLDAYMAAFLRLQGHVPDLLGQREKIVFQFAATDELYHDLMSYNSGALVEARSFTFMIKQLKSEIHSQRRDNEQCRKEEKDTISPLMSR